MKQRAGVAPLKPIRPAGRRTKGENGKSWRSGNIRVANHKQEWITGSSHGQSCNNFLITGPIKYLKAFHADPMTCWVLLSEIEKNLQYFFLICCTFNTQLFA